MNIKPLLLILLLQGIAFAGFSQTLNGNASVLSPGCFQLTPNAAWQAGSVWFPDTLNLNLPWVITCSMNFGTEDVNGADGIAIVLQNNDAFQLGGNGEGLGYTNIPSALDIEFDTFQNNNLGDPAVDHIAIMRDGTNIHTTANNLAGPVQAPPVGANIEDGLDHIVDIKWDPALFRLEVFFDCSLRLSLTLDIKNTIFGGDNLVRWGFTAGSGGSFNGHSVCLLAPPSAPIQHNWVLCPNDTVQLTAPGSFNNTWTWTPNWNISSTSVQSPLVFPTSDTTYHVSFQNRCNQAATDSFQVTVFNPGTMNLGPDTIVCGNPPLLLDATVPSGSYLWNNGDITPQTNATTSGTYWCTASIQGCSVSDTITVLFSPVSVDLGPDGPLCAGDTATLTADPSGSFPGSTYQWSDGSTAQDLTVTQSGSYAVTITLNGCTDSDTLNLMAGIYPGRVLPQDTLNCSGAPITLSAISGGAQYEWSTGDTTLQIQAFQPGLYTVTVTSADGCATVDSVTIIGSAPPTVELGVDTVYCGAGHSRLLDAFNPNSTYQWNTGSIDSVLIAVETGTYSVTVTNVCGMAQDSVHLTFFEFPEGYFIPNVFTPNNDGINDAFWVQSARPEEYQLTVYDRWGKRQYSTLNHMDKWDGANAPEGVYYYVILTTDCQGFLVQKVGWVTLVR